MEPMEDVTEGVSPVVDRDAYVLRVLEQLHRALRVRDVHATPSQRWGDPRAQLESGAKRGRRFPAGRGWAPFLRPTCPHHHPQLIHAPVRVADTLVSGTHILAPPTDGPPRGLSRSRSAPRWTRSAGRTPGVAPAARL